MDDPALDAVSHFQALRGLARINAWSRSVDIVWAPIRALARRTWRRSFRVLDIATGAGDIPIALWHTAQRSGLDLTIDGCDKSPQAMEYATRRAAQSGAGPLSTPPLRFFTRDVMCEEIPAGYDIILCSLFLHHLGRLEATALLARGAYRRGLIGAGGVHDSRGSGVGAGGGMDGFFFGATLACAIFSGGK